MEWNRLLSPKRPGNYGKSSSNRSGDLRSEFEKDYHRIIGSSSFRRLQDKTQVFALDKSDFIRTRLTHSLEVSSFARSLGQNIAQYIIENKIDGSFNLQTKSDICDILQCAGLIHDLGNPPFGHFGEEAIRDWFLRKMGELRFQDKPVTELFTGQMLEDFYHFEGNAQALRQVSKLHFLVNEYGMNLTYALLNTIIKYPVSSENINPKSGDIKDKKMGFFYAEQPLYEMISTEMGTEGVRHPLTYILEAADDIAYRTADIEDAFKKGCISYEKLREELVKAQKKADDSFCDISRLDPVGMLDHQFDNAMKREVENPQLYAVQNFLVRLQSALIFCATSGFTSNYVSIMDGTWKHDLFYHTYGEWVIKALGDIAFQYAFLSKPILQMEVSAGTILDFLMDRFVPAIMNYDTEIPLKMLDKKLVSLISENYRQIYHLYARNCTNDAEKLYLRFLLVTDFVSGMTDSYAKDLYQKLNGIS
ncbi:MAG: deoxyguanosinetriphosphate triphosphohydrolase [Eubacteriales bacterium]|nr:deoxyguanosinetriphosphate triphosphohydrolase [Eubacteriales bacterium]